MSSKSFRIRVKINGKLVDVVIAAANINEAKFIAQGQYGSQFVAVLGPA